MKPVIGVLSTNMQGQGFAPKMQTGADYLAEIQRAQGIPLQLPCLPEVTTDTIAQWLSICDGFLLPGGGDVAPCFYGEHPLPQLTRTHRVEDAIELALARAAAEKGLPLLGICRGCQSLNVAFGGTLWQDITAQYKNVLCHMQDTALRTEVFHDVFVQSNTLLATIMGEKIQPTNTFHHQAVCNVASDFVASAHTPDGLIEAIEHKNGRIVGVQWHPENLAQQYPSHAALFVWLVQMAHKVCKK